MDEYRPFPAQEPADLDEDSPARTQSAGATPAATGRTGPAGAAPENGQEREERAEPDREHPGGHLRGTVARLNRPRRFGFLRADDGAEVFFHASAIDTGPNAFDALRPGQEAEFDCHQDEQGRGLAATVVTIVGEPPELAPRPPRQPKSERQPREPREPRELRGGRGTAAAVGWHVAVLRERFDSPVTSQLERLLNERNIKPGQFTLTVVERQEGTECWVAFHTGDKT